MHIRPVRDSDADAMAAIYAPIVLETTISFEWQPPSVEAWRERIAKVTARYPWLVAIDDDEQVQGFVYASTHRDPPSYQWSVNTSVFIHEHARGRGLGKALYQALHRQLVELGYYRAFAGIALPNASSVALHESVGYRPIGVYEGVGFKFGQWRDVGWWQKELQPQVGEPQPIRLPSAEASRSG